MVNQTLIVIELKLVGRQRVGLRLDWFCTIGYLETYYVVVEVCNTNLGKN